MKPVFHYLRITFSATCLIAGVLLIALWVRSYKAADRLHGHTSDAQAFLIASKEGRIASVLFRWQVASNWFRWNLISYPSSDELSFPVGPIQQYKNKFGFGWLDHPMYPVMRSRLQLPNGTNRVCAAALVVGAELLVAGLTVGSNRTAKNGRRRFVDG